MYTLPSKLKLFAIIFMVVGALGMLAGFLTAPSTTAEVKEMMAAHGDGHGETASHDSAEGNHSGTHGEIPLGTEIYEQVGSSGNASTGDYLVRAIPVSGKVTLDPGDYVRIFGQTISSPGTPRNSIRIYSVSLTLD